MTYKISFLAEAEEDLAWFRKHSKKDYIKCFDLVRDVANEPRKGIGKPERLRHFDGQVHSRRVNRKEEPITNL